MREYLISYLSERSHIKGQYNPHKTEKRSSVMRSRPVLHSDQSLDEEDDHGRPSVTRDQTSPPCVLR